MKKVAILTLLAGWVILPAQHTRTARRKWKLSGHRSGCCVGRMRSGHIQRPGAVGADFCKNIALGASTTFADLFAEAAGWNPRSGLGISNPTRWRSNKGPSLPWPTKAVSHTPLLR